MRTFWKWALVLAVPAVGVAAARPAELPVPEGTTVKLILLRQKSVQKELKLTPDAVRKIMAFTNKQYEEARKALELGMEERRRKFEALGRENRKFLADNLNPGQRKRLDQITMQLTGLMQLRRPEVARALELTEDQSRKVKEMQTEARKHLRELIDAKDSEGRKEKLAKLREQTRKKVMALLTDKQRAKVRELVGEPFKGEIVFENDGPEDKSDK
jgi:hypothetical protein